MKTKALFLTAFTSLCWIAHGQGTFIYDQESASSDYVTGEVGYDITSNQPFGQSFTPVLNSIGFVRLQLANFTPAVSPVTVYLNLWSGSIEGGGSLLGSTDPVVLPYGFGTGGFLPLSAETNFFFSSPVSVTPGETYYLQPIVQSGATVWGNGNVASYSGGSLFLKGTADGAADLWFREGIYVVPEPSPSWLVLLGCGILICFRHRRTKRMGQKVRL